MPGRFLERVARHFLPTGACESVLEPLLADLQHEWRTRQPGAGRLLALVRGYAAFWQALAWCGARVMAREAMSPPTPGVSSRAVSGFIACAVSLIALQLLGAVVQWRGAWGMLPLVGWWMVINTLATTFPLGVISACLRARTRAQGPRPVDGVRIALLAAVLTGVTAAWVTPWAQRQHAASVRQHHDAVVASIASRPGHQPYRWQVAASPAQTRARTSVQMLVALTLATAWIGWTVARPRLQGLPTILSWWVVIYFLLNVNEHVRAPGLGDIWRDAMIFVIGTVLVQLELRKHVTT